MPRSGVFWDGLVSALRAHSPEELQRMTESFSREGYTWEVGQVSKPGKPPVTYVLGLPGARRDGASKTVL